MCNQDGVFSTTMRCIGMYLEVVCGLKRHKKYALMIIMVLSQKNVPTDVEHVEPALAYVGALNSIGVVMTLSINGRIVESVNMKIVLMIFLTRTAKI
jgi:hypothetical protein